MTQQTPPTKTPNPLAVMIRTFVHDLMWRVVETGIKAALIMFLWNGFVATIFLLPTLAFGNAFAIVALVAILFSNLNEYSKFQTYHLFDLKTLISQLIINQHAQNISIISLLTRQTKNLDENDKIVPEVNKTVDGKKKNGYNTEELENK